MKLLLLLFLLMQAEPDFQKSVKKPKKLKHFPFGTWMRSQEEDKDPNAAWLLYRPGSYNFPPARGRSGFVVEKGGKFALIGPSPADRQDTSRGSWTLVSKGCLNISVPGSELKQLKWKAEGKDKLLVELK